MTFRILSNLYCLYFVIFLLIGCQNSNYNKIYSYENIYPLINLNLDSTEMQSEFSDCMKIKVELLDSVLVIKNEVNCDNTLLKGNLYIKRKVRKFVVDNRNDTSEYSPDIINDSIISNKFLHAISDDEKKKYVEYYETDMNIDWGENTPFVIYIYDDTHIGLYMGAYMIKLGSLKK